MPTVLKNDIHTNIAQIVYNGIRSRTTRAYFALGRTLPWEGDDVVAPVPTAAREDEAETRAAIIGMRSITISDVSFAIERNNWETGTVYDMYDDRYSSEFVAPSGATDIAEASMFVMTDEFNIYKCISNNYNSPSTVKPTGNSTGYIGPLSDGYVWKYMDTVDIIQRNKYLSPEYIPVSNSVEGRYFQSGLTPIIVENGTGYDPNNTLLQVVGDGTGADFTPVIDENGQITSIIVNDAGNGYSVAEVIVSTPDTGQPQGTGAVINVNLDLGDLETPQADVQLSAVDGDISFIYVNSQGSGYTEANTTVTINGNGINAQAIPVIVSGAIVGIRLTNRGEGYTSATVVIEGDGTGATADAIISPVGGHGRNIISESFADTLAFHTSTIDETNQGITLENDYRQISLIIDPDKFVGTGELRQKFTADYGSACYAVEIPGGNEADFTLDQEVINRVTEDSMYVVGKKSVTGGASLLLFSLDGSEPEVGDEFVDSEGDLLFTVGVNSITYPTVDKFSGSMVSINNRPSFRRNVEQIVNLRTYINF